MEHISIQSVPENGLVPGGKESKGGRQTIFFTPLNPFGGDSDEEEEPCDDYTFAQIVHYHSSWKRDQDAVYWVKLSRAQDQELQFWQTKSHASRLHLLCNLSKQRSNTVGKTLNPTTRAESHT